jgi:hypothetical protein
MIDSRSLAIRFTAEAKVASQLLTTASCVKMFPKAAALRNKAKETPAFGYDLALRVGGIMLQQLQATRIRLLDICEV